jgi:benzoyl-CoA reductase/2-hydroxyglutaryl-CoA dehydratase subunit BcrC/BadD/HgdB
MKTLSETWFADGYIDFELKKYTLLAYLQEINRYFGENKLYPQLAEVIFHYNNLVAFRENKKFLQERFPKKLSGLQIERLQVLFEQMIEDDDLMRELEEIIDYSAVHMKTAITNGTEIYEFVEEKLTIQPVGIMPLNSKEGYFLLSEGSCHATRVYSFRMSFFEKQEEKYRSIRTEYIDSWQRSISNTYEQIKAELLARNSSLAHPAVYSIETSLKFPVDETLLPVAKRSLVRYISTRAA